MLMANPIGVALVVELLLFPSHRSPAGLALERIGGCLEGLVPGLSEVGIGLASFVGSLTATARRLGRVRDIPSRGKGCEETALQKWPGTVHEAFFRCQVVSSFVQPLGRASGT